jgi:hypothetical protein
MFVYPRMPDLIASYIEAFGHCALEKVIWLGHRSDWPDAESLLRSNFSAIELHEGPGLASYELLAMASMLRQAESHQI